MSDVFRFKLDTVLDLRTRTEDERAQDLAAARRQREDARRKRQELEEARYAKTQEIRQATGHGNGKSVGQLKNLNYVLEWLDDRIRFATEAEEAASQQVDTTQDAYSQAVRDRMSLDRLKDRQHEAWSADMRKAEQDQMDEVAATRHETSRRMNAEDGV